MACCGASRSTSSPMSASRSAPVERLERAAGDGLHRRRRPLDRAELPPFRASVTVDDLRATVARYLGEERTNRSFESFARAAGSGSISRRRGRHPPPALRRAPSRLGDRRRVVAARAVAPPAPAQRLDAATRCGSSTTPRRRSSTAATSCSTPSTTPARASPCSTASCASLAWNRAFIDLYELPPELVRIGVGLDEIVALQRRARLLRPGPADELADAAPPTASSTTTEPQRVRLHPTGRVIEVPLEPAAGRRLRHDLHRRHRDRRRARRARSARTSCSSSASANAPRS